MSEPAFLVPLSALVETYESGWTCLPCLGVFEGGYTSRAEAESAAIAHLAEVHGLTTYGSDVQAVELSYWLGRLLYCNKVEDLPRIRELMRDRLEELEAQGDAIAYGETNVQQ